jgi:hypothetical protein
VEVEVDTLVEEELETIAMHQVEEGLPLRQIYRLLQDKQSLDSIPLMANLLRIQPPRITLLVLVLGLLVKE